MTSQSTYPTWVFDGSPIDDPLGAGERAVQFLRRLRHPASTAPKRAFQLAPWQERIVRRIYGPRDAQGARVVKMVFLMIPRGNRKTSLAAALALLHLLGPERVPAGQIIFAASDREQAGIGFREAAEIIRQDRRLEAVTRLYDAHNAPKAIKSTRDGSALKAVSSDGRAQHGTTPTFVLSDEIHVWQGRELWEALQSSMAKRAGGLTVIATTAGRGNEGLAAELYASARGVALGQIVNPEFLPILFEPEPGADREDEALWHRVNPGLAHGFAASGKPAAVQTESAPQREARAVHSGPLCKVQRKVSAADGPPIRLRSQPPSITARGTSNRSGPMRMRKRSSSIVNAGRPSPSVKTGLPASNRMVRCPPAGSATQRLAPPGPVRITPKAQVPLGCPRCVVQASVPKAVKGSPLPAGRPGGAVSRGGSGRLSSRPGGADSRKKRPSTQPGPDGVSTRHHRAPAAIAQPLLRTTSPGASFPSARARAEASARRASVSPASSPVTAQKSGPPDRPSAKSASAGEATSAASSGPAQIRRILRSFMPTGSPRPEAGSGSKDHGFAQIVSSCPRSSSAAAQ
ncbi:phage terminase [Rhodobacter viridis]|uniref:Phage terminase n=1 Tax=Rhodobacter viridis TaxID=1054202 RepID=A0A318TPC1_9RHOB|nr:phage terminase [Rhodobacter viridis]